MGQAKRLAARAEYQQDIGTSIAIQAGTLGVCEFHGEAFSGEAEIQLAYRLGNSKFTSGKLGDVFASRLEMTDAIKAAVDDHPADECPRCAKFRSDE